MKALKVIAIIALLVGIGWLAYLIGFEAANKQNAEIKTDEEKEIKEDEKEKEPEYVPSKVLEVPMEDEVEKKEVTVNTPLDPFGKSLQGLSDSDFRSEDPDEFPGGIDDSVKQIGTWVSNAREEYQYKTITGQEVQTELGYYLTRLADSYQPIESIKLVTESGSTYSLSPRSSAIEQEDFSTYIDWRGKYRKKMYYYKTGKFQRLEYLYMPETTTSTLSDEIITGDKVISLIQAAIPNFYSEQKAYLDSIGKQTRIDDPLLMITVDNGSQSGSFDLTDDLHPSDIYTNGIDKYAFYRFAKDYYDKGNTKTMYFRIVE